jgi:tight adherence protein C
MSAHSLVESAGTYLTTRIGDISLGPGETLILALALAAVLLSGFHLWRLGNREDRQMRLAALRGATPDPAHNSGVQRLPWYRPLGSLVAASPILGASERQRLLNVLAAAGIKRQGRLASLVAGKLCGALALAALVWLFLEWRHLFATVLVVRLGILCGALMIGWRLPDIILSHLVARRRRYIEQGMPDALDLLVICAEAGLSLNQAIEVISSDLRPSNPAVADEFAETAAEMRVQPDVTQALDNMVRRIGLDSLSGVIATLKQSMRFGTPLAESLRLLAAEMRTLRQARMEERAARLPVLLAIPLMMFILPSLLMVIGTPVGLRIFDTMKNVMRNLPSPPA